jgi:5'-methylthioadenosine phosphorylase
MKRIGVIGGSGLYEMEGLTNVREERISTPFGDPSDALIIGTLQTSAGAAELVFLPRHARGHRLLPSEVPYRANIYAMKTLGVEWILSISAVGSLKENIPPGDMVIIDQFIDKTYKREGSFFGQGCVAHVGFGDPICPTLRGFLLEAAEATMPGKVHNGGTYVCMEGPAFSTKAESMLHRSWGASVIGMTNMPEAKLAREAEISYATLAMATDFDCWHPDHDHVTVEAVIGVLLQNVDNARKIIQGIVPRILAYNAPSPQASALKNAIMTRPELIPAATRERLDLLIGKYLNR